MLVLVVPVLVLVGLVLVLVVLVLVLVAAVVRCSCFRVVTVVKIRRNCCPTLPSESHVFLSTKTRVRVYVYNID